MATKTASKTRNAPVRRYHGVYQTDIDHERTARYIIEFAKHCFQKSRQSWRFKRFCEEDFQDATFDYIISEEELYGRNFRFGTDYTRDVNGVCNLLRKHEVYENEVAEYYAGLDAY